MRNTYHINHNQKYPRGVRQRRLAGGRTMLSVECADDTGVMEAVWWNAPWVREKLERHAGEPLLVFGKVKRFRGAVQMDNPQFEAAGGDAAESLNLGRIGPIYPCTGTLTQTVWRKAMAAALDGAAGQLAERYPADYLARRGLPGLGDAVRAMHFPPDRAARDRARGRLAWDEALLMQLAVLAARRHRLADRPGRSFAMTPELDARIRRLFPFRLTAAQNRAVDEIAADMRAPTPMHRLLQGDVGSGKTAVALYAMLAAVANRTQAVVMAPTGLLARQHDATIRRFLENSPSARVEVALLAGGQKDRERRAVLERLKHGAVDILCATHAAVQDRVAFRDLGLVVIDEQHKFGVRQRAALLDKGVRPDTLVMTATPIPRSLALTVYGDLDVSVIGELPPGRQGVRTTIAPRAREDDVWRFVRAELGRGRQAFVVSPRLEPSDEDPENDAEGAGGAKGGGLFAAPGAGGGGPRIQSAVDAYEDLRRRGLAGYRLGLMHGKMKRPDQEALMEEVRACRLDALVSTVVIEVGVDVPNASVMVVLHAERFGLAQLHQLRGRVGRGVEEGHFVLMSDSRGEEALRRLGVLAQTSDGFKIAEADLRIRGPGQFFGVRQHGLAEMKLLDLAEDMDLLVDARDEAKRLLDRDPGLEAPSHAALRRALVGLYGEDWTRAATG